MKRTRKWAFVAQEATRLAGLGLSPLEISKRLGVNKSTVTRWIADGKLKLVERTPASVDAVIERQTPEQWAASVRKDYDLDATDDQLVTLAETALSMSIDPRVPAHVRMAASGRFQAIVRQLALTTRGAVAGTGPDNRQDQPTGPVPVESRKNPPVKRPGGDPRALMMAG